LPSRLDVWQVSSLLELICQLNKLRSRDREFLAGRIVIPCPGRPGCPVDGVGTDVRVGLAADDRYRNPSDLLASVVTRDWRPSKLVRNDVVHGGILPVASATRSYAAGTQSRINR